MDKRRAIQIMTKAAQLYKEHLEDQKVLFLYGLPKEVNKQLQESNKILSSVQGYEVGLSPATSATPIPSSQQFGWAL